MINKTHLALIFTALLLSPLSLLAQNDNEQIKELLCPEVSALQKDPVAKTWNADNKNWKSYEISFVDKVSSFIGAQWTGAQLGQVTCLYGSDEAKSFPILLVFKTLTYVPTTGKWTNDLGGYRDCRSQKREECPFKMRLQPQDGTVDQQLEQLKQMPKSK